MKPSWRSAALGAVVALALTTILRGPTTGAAQTSPQIPIPAANEPVVSNVRDYYATISWVTAEKTAGQVQFGRSPGVYSGTAVDKRGPSYVGWTHYVDLAGLEANATYYYKIQPGDSPERSFTTAPPTNFPPSPEPSLAGRIWKSSRDAAEEANVYVMVAKPDGTASALLSSFAQVSTLPSGEEATVWSVVLSNARTQDLSSFMNVPSSPSQQDGWQVTILVRYSGDPTHFVETTVNLKDVLPTMPVELTIPNTGPTPTASPTSTATPVQQPVAATATAVTAATATAAAQVPALTPTATPTSTPRPSIMLTGGWNLVSWPLTPDATVTADSLVEAMRQQGSFVRHVARWQNGRWQSFLPGFPAEDYALEYGRGYFVYVAEPGRWQP